MIDLNQSSVFSFSRGSRGAEHRQAWELWLEGAVRLLWPPSCLLLHSEPRSHEDYLLGAGTSHTWAELLKCLEPVGYTWAHLMLTVMKISSKIHKCVCLVWYSWRKKRARIVLMWMLLSPTLRKLVSLYFISYCLCLLKRSNNYATLWTAVANFFMLGHI